MPTARTRAKPAAIDWLTEMLAELWERIKDHPADCHCWNCQHWRAVTR
jgi:hypothetical protein